MARIGIVGEGPGGLSAALFLAKAGHEVVVYGAGNTAMHHAYLYNYLGIDEIAGDEFQRRAIAQVASFGAAVLHHEVVAATRDDDTFELSAGDDTERYDYLILSEGIKAPLAAALGAGAETGGIDVDHDGRTSIDRLYVVGRSVRPRSSQAIISAGQGAAAALAILADLEGKPVQDWDAPPKQ